MISSVAKTSSIVAATIFPLLSNSNQQPTLNRTHSAAMATAAQPEQQPTGGSNRQRHDGNSNSGTSLGN
jgi:hypothetical protein